MTGFYGVSPRHLIGADRRNAASGARLKRSLAALGRIICRAGRVRFGAALLPLAEIGIPVLGEFAAPKRWSF